MIESSGDSDKQLPEIINRTTSSADNQIQDKEKQDRLEEQFRALREYVKLNGKRNESFPDDDHLYVSVGSIKAAYRTAAETEPGYHTVLTLSDSEEYEPDSYQAREMGIKRWRRLGEIQRGNNGNVELMLARKMQASDKLVKEARKHNLQVIETKDVFNSPVCRITGFPKDFGPELLEYTTNLLENMLKTIKSGTLPPSPQA